MMSSSRAAIAAYLRAMIRAFAPGSPPGRRLAEWLRDNQRRLGIDLDVAAHIPAPSAGQRIRLPDGEILSPRQWDGLACALEGAGAETERRGDPVGENLDALAAALDLDAEGIAVFRFVFEAGHDKSFEWLCEMLLETRAVDTLGLIAVGIGSDPTSVWRTVSTGTLGALQLVKVAMSNGPDFTCHVPSRIANALLPPNLGVVDVERHLIGRSLKPTLDASDFTHIAMEVDFIKRLLGNAAVRREAGINVLLHGLPGTGKTELCKTIAAALELDLFAVGESDEWGGEPDRNERLEALCLADRLAHHRGRTLLLFDEMQDILPRGAEISSYRRRKNAGSKIYMNRLLENNRVPILWTSNDVSAFDPAFIRRMSYVLEMKPLPLAARARMVATSARRYGLALDLDRATALARRYRVAPGVVSGAMAAVKVAGGAVDEIAFAADALARAAEGADPRVPIAAAPFMSELANADLDLAALQHRIAAANAPRDFSLFLYGPPGTGKSAFARHLAEVIDLEPLFRRASDLLSPWVGVAEQNLAQAFAEAREDRRFLIIDEAEPFLWGRSGASRSWEVSMVDEFLVQMENHPLPLACTSNLVEAVDPAALRRFTFKVKFDFLTPDQVVSAYRHFFKRSAPTAVRELTSLTPSDFAAITKQCRLLGEAEIGDDRLMAMLEREAAVKNVPARKIGF